MKEINKQIFVYDSECLTCSKFINFIVKYNKNNSIYVTDFHSVWYKNHKKDNLEDSSIYVKNGVIYKYSSAILHVLADTRTLMKPIIIFKLIPKFIRDNIYLSIAKRRKKNIGKCELATPEFKNIYLS